MRSLEVRRVLADLADGVVETLLELGGVDLGAVFGVQAQRDVVSSGFDVKRLELPILGSRAASTALLAFAESCEQLSLLPRLHAVDLDLHAVGHLVYPILSHVTRFSDWSGLLTLRLMDGAHTLS